MPYGHGLTEIAGGDWWTDEYNVKPAGILKCPCLKMELTPVEITDEGSEEGWEVVDELHSMQSWD